MTTTLFRISETDNCPKCGKWNPSPMPFYEQGFFRERMRVSCACGYSVTYPCLDARLVERMDRLIERMKAWPEA